MCAEKATETQGRKPGYYIVIPASVWFDERLRPNSTKLYGVISALCSSEGYCWAGDAYLGEMLHQSERTVRELLRELVDCGHLWVDKQGGRRRIWIAPPQASGENPPERPAEIRQNAGENPPDNNQSSNNQSNNIPPYHPPEGEGAEEAPAKDTATRRRDELEQWYQLLEDNYPADRLKGKAEARRAFFRLKPDRALMTLMWRSLQAHKRYDQDWARGYAPSFGRWMKDRRWEDAVKYAQAQEGSSAVVEDEGVTYW